MRTTFRLDMFSNQMKTSFYKIYRKALDGLRFYMKKTSYSRADFEPRFWSSDPSVLQAEDRLPLKKSVQAILDSLPAVSFWAFLDFLYDVLYLEAVTTELIDPFGTNSSDLSLDKACRESGRRVTSQIKS